jgi:hypothetical protein
MTATPLTVDGDVMGLPFEVCGDASARLSGLRAGAGASAPARGALSSVRPAAAILASAIALRRRFSWTPDWCFVRLDDGRPVAVSYRLTERGQGLSPAMDALRVWAGAPVDEHGQALPFSAVTHGDEAS